VIVRILDFYFRNFWRLVIGSLALNVIATGVVLYWIFA
jgi:hypothetical protein